MLRRIALIGDHASTLSATGGIGSGGKSRPAGARRERAVFLDKDCAV